MKRTQKHTHIHSHTWSKYPIQNWNWCNKCRWNLLYFIHSLWYKACDEWLSDVLTVFSGLLVRFFGIPFVLDWLEYKIKTTQPQRLQKQQTYQNHPCVAYDFICTRVMHQIKRSIYMGTFVALWRGSAKHIYNHAVLSYSFVLEANQNKNKKNWRGKHDNNYHCTAKANESNKCLVNTSEASN